MNRLRRDFWFQLLVILLFLLPVIVLFLLPGSALVATCPWFLLALLLCFFMMWMIFSTFASEPQEQVKPQPRILDMAEEPEVIKEVMNVDLATEERGAQIFRGRLLESAESVYEKLKHALPPQTVPMIQEDERLGTAIVLLPGSSDERTVDHPSRAWIHWLLFGLTVLTTTFAGAAHRGVNLLEEPARFAVGLPYALGLLAILGAHELGHFFMARRHGIRVTPPYFIPVPFALGTFGAFIQLKSPTENRRALFDVAVAGPLAGLVIAIPALLIGLQSSEVMKIPSEDGKAVLRHGTSAGSSILFALLAKLALPEALEQGCVIRLSPIAFAGWLGLFITALNLLPVGQLDGGHTARAMFGDRTGSTISTVALWSLFLLALFVWPALFLWVIIIFFIAGRGMPPLDDVTPISKGRKCLGYVTFAILAMILLPLPHALWSSIGLHCPYL